MTVTNLPVQLTSFIGRERELKEVVRLVSTARLITLTGAGGCGKTRLAIQVGNNISETFADGVWLIDFIPLHEPELVPQYLAQTFNLRQVPDQPMHESLLNLVQPKQLLLILDNCEHLIAAIAPLVQQLLATATELKILGTSRQPLGVSGELIYPMQGLGLPPSHSASAFNPQTLLQYDAVHLFIERAQAISPHFTITPENASAIIEICRRLDGIPLALELASARLNILTPQQIAARLDDRFGLLTSSQLTRITHHQTLRTAIDWSYDLLTYEEQTLLRRLAVFEAGCTLDIAESVCSGKELGQERTLDVLSSLVDKSLVMAETSGRPEARYRLLETIREYALKKLNEAGETAQLRDRHLERFLARAEEAAPKLGNAYQQLWLDWLEGEHDNLRAALAWTLESGRIEAGMRIAIAISRFWEIRGYVQEGMTWFERLLAQADENVSLVIRANAFTYASFLAMFLGNAPAATAYGREATALAEAAGDEGNPILILALSSLESGARLAGDYQTAFKVGERAIRLLRKSPESSFYLGMTLLAQGEVAIELGDYDTAHAVLEESLTMAREAGDVYRIAHSLSSVGDLARYQGNYAEAIPSYENSIELFRELSAQRDLASILCNLGRTCLLLGDVDRACTLFFESIVIHQAEQSMSGIAECLVGYAAAALMRQLAAAGARLLAAAAAIGGTQWFASMLSEKRRDYDDFLALAQTKLKETEFKSEQTAGQAMSSEQAIQFAQSLPLQSKAAHTASEKTDGLTGREREVAILIAQGKSNREIAVELVLSKRTVETHVRKILSKLGFTNRAQVVRWAIDRGLTQSPK